MSEENKEIRIKVEDLPQAEQELTSEESKEVKGGAEVVPWLWVKAPGEVNKDGIIATGSDVGSAPHIKK
jgi:hypothetical protein